MTTQAVMLAILSMDSYDRGPNSALSETNGINNIGGAMVSVDSTSVPDDFYAVAYTYGGTTIISYRGTDSLKDALTGWPVGGGISLAPQVIDAEQFYTQVTGKSPFEIAPNTILTGHSLGAGLAGYISALSGTTAAVFDTAPYGLAAIAATILEDARRLGTDVVTAGAVLFGGGQQGLVGLPSAASITSTSVYGEALSPVRAAEPQVAIAGLTPTLGAPVATKVGTFLTNLDNAQTNVVLPSYGGLRNPVDLHSMALLAMLQWASSAGLTAWQSIGRPLTNSLFDDRLGASVGRSTSTGGTSSPASQLQRMIAYTAIDDPATTVFGNTAIHAMYNDADKLGQIASANGTSADLLDSQVQQAVTNIAVEYAGVLASNYDTTQSDPSATTGHEKGALDHNTGSGFLAVDLSDPLWTLTAGTLSGSVAKIVGRDALINEIATDLGYGPLSMQLAEKALWGGTSDHIQKITMATTDQATQFGATDGTSNKGTDGVVLLGAGGSDTLVAGAGNELLMAGSGNTTFRMYNGAPAGQPQGLSGIHWVDGGLGTDTADYSKSPDALTVTLAATNGFGNLDSAAFSDHIVMVADGTAGSTDYLNSVEKINLGTGDNTVNVMPLARLPDPDAVTIDLGAQAGGSSRTTLDFSLYGSTVYLNAGSDGATTLYKNSSFTHTTNYSFKNFTTVALSSPLDKVRLLGSAGATQLKTVNAMGARDSVYTDVQGVTVNLIGGQSTLLHGGQGDMVNLGKGGNAVVLSNDILVTGAKANDVIENTAGQVLHGALGNVNSESVWVTGNDGTQYSIDTDGELVVKDAIGDETFIANYQGGPNVPLSDQTAGILVGTEEVDAERLLQLKHPYGTQDIKNTFQLGNDITFADTGKHFFAADPLVLDLSGQGLALTGESSASPIFDMFGTGFGVHTGWVQPSGGILVIAKPDGSVTSVDQFVGGENSSGFGALAQLDSNGDGAIDANDPIYSQLRIWEDTNGNGSVDPGELLTLAQAGIASINVSSMAAPVDGLSAGPP